MKKRFLLSIPIQAALIYITSALLWILIAGEVIASLNLSPYGQMIADRLEDLGFVALTSAVLIVTLRRYIGHLRAIEVIRDYTRQALFDSVSRYDSLETISPAGIFYADRDGRWLAFNKRYSEITGLSSAEAAGDGWMRAIVAEDRERVVEEWRTAIHDTAVYHTEYRIRRPGGEIAWVVSRVTPIRDARGTGDFLGVLMDITPQKQAEDALKQAAHDYQLLFDRNPLPVWIYDLETLRFLAVNDTAIEMYGYTRDEFLAMTIKQIRPPEEVASLANALSTPCDGRVK